MRRPKLFVASAVMMLSSFPAFAQDATQPDLSLDDLLNLNVTVASRKPLTPRESPGIVTVVTRDEIRDSGARDLIDILRLVPGFNFGLDVYSVVGVGFRGIWGHEGKVLLLIDGLELNEPFFGTTHFGNHYDVESIERLEIIRGPGSAIYGGYAELAVINIVTMSGAALKGGEASVTYGRTRQGGQRRNLSAAYGIGTENFEGSVAGFLGRSVRSDRRYHDNADASYDMLDNSAVATEQLNAGFKAHGLEGRVFYDRYTFEERDEYGAQLDEKAKVLDLTKVARLAYNFSPTSTLTLTPHARYAFYQPWYMSDLSKPSSYQEKEATRQTLGLSASFDATPELNLIAGVERTEDQAKAAARSPDDRVWRDDSGNVRRTSSYSLSALYAQLLFKNPVANLTVGTRSERHSLYGTTNAPRLALTKALDDLHMKLMYSQAFRSPSFENLRLNEDINPERTTVVEAEAGYRLSKTSQLVVNAFQTLIKDPIVYTTLDPSEVPEGALLDSYRNADRTGTRGVEVEGRVIDSWGRVAASYSHYSAKGLNEVEEYETDDDAHLLAFPRDKIALSAALIVARDYVIAPSAVYFGSRYAYTYAPQSEEEEKVALEKLAPLLLVDLNLARRNLLVRNLDVSLAIHNMTDAKDDFAQPYNGAHPPLPGSSREISGRVGYSF